MDDGATTLDAAAGAAPATCVPVVVSADPTAAAGAPRATWVTAGAATSSAAGWLGGAFGVPSPVAGHPPGRYAVCRTCRRPAAKGLASCWSCRRVRSQLGGSATPVVPLFVFSLGSAAHRALVGYKSAPSPTARCAWCCRLEMMLAAFLEHHARCLVGPRSLSALIVPVPSTIGGRPSWGGRHPVGALAQGALDRGHVNGAVGVDLRLAEVLRAGPVPPRRLEARAAGFEVIEGAADELPGAAVVVVDDIFTSGARALSAAATLAKAGADVAAVVPIGRLVRPDHNVTAAAFWADCSRSPWDPGRCAACGPTIATSLAYRSAPAAVVARMAA